MSGYGGFEGKVAIVTGASTGIGAATARLLAREGASIVCASRAKDTLDAIVAEIRASGGQAIGISTDVSNEEDVVRMVDRAIGEYGRLDYAVNNAAYTPIARLVDMSVDEFDATSDTNFRGLFMCMKYEIPHMVRAGGGAIVNIASAAGHRGTPGQSAYGATKWAMQGMTKTAAMEHGADNVRVNQVSPGAVESVLFGKYVNDAGRDRIRSITPLGRIGQPDELADPIVFLLSDKARWITGAVLNVDGGLMCGFSARKDETTD